MFTHVYILLYANFFMRGALADLASGPSCFPEPHGVPHRFPVTSVKVSLNEVNSSAAINPDPAQADAARPLCSLA